MGSRDPLSLNSNSPPKVPYLNGSLGGQGFVALSPCRGMGPVVMWECDVTVRDCIFKTFRKQEMRKQQA